MPVDAGTAYLKIEPDFSSFRSAVHREVNLRPVTQDVKVKVDEHSLRGATRQIAEHSKVYEGLKSTITGTTAALVGGGSLVAGLVEAVKAGAAEETALARLGKATSNAGISWKGHREEIEHWITSTARAKGFMDTDLDNAFANMIRSTGSVKEAQVLLNDAMDISRTKGMDLAQSQSLVARVYNGSYIGLKRLGIAITPVTTEQDKLKESTKKATVQQKEHAKALDHHATQLEALGLIQKKFGGQSAVYANTTTGHYARLRVAFDQIEETIGRTLLPTLDKLAVKGVKAAGDFQKHWPEIKQDIKDVVGPIKAVGGAMLDFAKANPDLTKTAVSVGLIAAAAVKMKDSALGRSIGALLNLTKLAGVRLPGGIGGGGGGALTTTVGEMTVDMMVVKTMVGGGGGGADGWIKTAEKDAEKGAGSASILSRLKTFLRGSPESPAGGAASFAKLAQDSPLRAALWPVLGVAAFSGMSKADNTAKAKISAAIEAVDPTQVLNVFGIPSVSQLVLGDPSAHRKSLQRVISGRPETKGWAGPTSLTTGGALAPKPSTSAAQMTRDFLAMNTQLAKLQTHQQGIKATAFNLDYLAKQAKKIGDVKWNVADRLGAEMLKARGVSSKGVGRIIGELGKLKPGAKRQAELAMLQMSNELQQTGKVPEGTTQKLVNRLVDHFADLQKGAKKHSDRMVRDLLDNIRLIGTKGTPINAHTRDTLIGQFEDLRKRGGDKFNNPKTGIKAEAIKAFQDLRAGVVPTGDSTAQALYGAFRAMGVNANELAASLGIKPIQLKLTPVGKLAGAVTSGIQGVVSGLPVFHHAGGGLVQIGRPGAAGHDNVPLNMGGVPIAVGEGEQVAVFNRHQAPIMNEALARMGYGGLPGLFKRVNKLNWMGGGGIPQRRFATGGTLSYGQLEGLWTGAGGPAQYASLMAAIALAESGGRDVMQQGEPWARTGWGYWQITPGGPQYLDPMTNARAAVSKFVAAHGPSPWTTYTSGAYRAFLHGGIPAIGGVTPEIARAIISGPDGGAKHLAQGEADWGRKAINAYLRAHAPTFAVAGPAGGPVGVGRFQGLPVANWVIAALEHASSKGVGFQITSGYRPGFDPHTASGTSEHSGTQYPHGAVDFGGFHDPHALAEKLAVVAATSDFKWPLLAPIGFVDDGHASGTGHARGGLLRAFATGTPHATRHGHHTRHRHRKPWWQRALDELKKGTHLTKGPKLDKLLANLRHTGLAGWDKPLAKHGGDVARDQALQQVASGLIDTDKITALLTKDPKLWPDPTKPISKQVMHSILHRLGTSVQGKDALEWLRQQLVDQMMLRHSLINLAHHIRKQYDERKKILERALKRRKELAAEVKKLTLQLHPPGKHAKAPTGARRKQLAGQLATATKRLAAVQSVITVTQNQMGGLNTAWGAGLSGGSLKALYDLYGPTSSGGAGTQDVLGQLYALQGPVTDNRIFKTGLTAQGLIRALPGSLRNWYGDIGGTLGAMNTFGSDLFTAPDVQPADVAVSDPFAIELQRLQSQRDLLSQLQAPVIASFPYGGSFADGGTVPGPPGKPILITAHGGEQYLGVGEQSTGGHTFEIHGDSRTVAILEQMIETVNVRSNRGQARSADRRMRLPGNQVR
jgi:hypothetical protein